MKLDKPQLRPKVPKKENSLRAAKKAVQSIVGLVALTALAIDGVRLRADDAQYMLVVGIGFALLCLYLAFEGSRK